MATLNIATASRNTKREEKVEIEKSRVTKQRDAAAMRHPFLIFAAWFLLAYFATLAQSKILVASS